MTKPFTLFCCAVIGILGGLFNDAAAQWDPWHKISQTKDGSVEFMVFDRVSSMNQYVLNCSTDTQKKRIVIEEKGESHYQIETCKMTQLQIDGKGSKEVLIQWTEQISGPVSYTEENYGVKTCFRIWNLDTETELFAAVSDYMYVKIRMDGNETTVLVDSARYHYDLHLAPNLGITLSGLEARCAVYTYPYSNMESRSKEAPTLTVTHCEPLIDHRMGTYHFVNGTFVLDP